MNGYPQFARQKGIVLVVGLVFLLVLTILGVTTLRTTTLEERMAGNLMSKTLAFQDAEATIAAFLNSVNDRTSNLVNLSTQNDCSGDEALTNLSKNDPTMMSNSTCSRYLGSSTVARQTDTADGGQTGFSHFRIESESVTQGNAQVLIHQGIAIRSPRAPNISVESEAPPSSP